MTRDEVVEVSERAANSAVKQTFLAIGIDVANPLDAQRDFVILREVGKLAMDPEFRKDIEHTRRWRKTIEATQAKGFLTVLAGLITGAGALLVLGLQSFFGKH